MLQKEFPILEFDEDNNAFIRPSNLIKPVKNIPERCILCFFSEAIEKIITEYPHKIISYFKSEGFNYPLYELDYNGENKNRQNVVYKELCEIVAKMVIK